MVDRASIKRRARHGKQPEVKPREPAKLVAKKPVNLGFSALFTDPALQGPPPTASRGQPQLSTSVAVMKGAFHSLVPRMPRKESTHELGGQIPFMFDHDRTIKRVGPLAV